MLYRESLVRRKRLTLVVDLDEDGGNFCEFNKRVARRQNWKTLWHSHFITVENLL